MRYTRISTKRPNLVVVDGLSHCNYEQNCGMANRHAHQPLCDTSTVKSNRNSLDGVVVQCALQIRCIQLIMLRVEGVDVINQLLPFVDPHVCREQMPDKGIEVMKGGRCEGFHLRNVYRDRAPSASWMAY